MTLQSDSGIGVGVIPIRARASWKNLRLLHFDRPKIMRCFVANV
jgi:hypothetical protein